MFAAASGGLVIDWTQMPTYNTIMSVAAGAGLLSIVWFGARLNRERDVHLEGWALAFAVPGAILAATGLHMTLTWPFAKYFPFDNIIFGEPSLAFGVLLLAAAFYLWRRGTIVAEAADPPAHLARAAAPMSIFVIGMGLALLAVAAAGLVFQLFAAPPEEPISGLFASTPWVEASFMSGLFGLAGIGSVLAPFAIRGYAAGSPRTSIQLIVGWTWVLSGLGFFLFGALNFFTHIGLIIHTMG